MLERGNGMARWKVLELRRQRERALERAQIEADRTVLRLMDCADEERERLEQLRAQRAELERQVGELERAATSEESLETLLRRADAAGTLEPVLLRMRFEEVRVDADVAP